MICVCIMSISFRTLCSMQSYIRFIFMYAYFGNWSILRCTVFFLRLGTLIGFAGMLPGATCFLRYSLDLLIRHSLICGLSVCFRRDLLTYSVYSLRYFSFSVFLLYLYAVLFLSFSQVYCFFRVIVFGLYNYCLHKIVSPYHCNELFNRVLVV